MNFPGMPGDFLAELYLGKEEATGRLDQRQQRGFCWGLTGLQAPSWPLWKPQAHVGGSLGPVCGAVSSAWLLCRLLPGDCGGVT